MSSNVSGINTIPSDYKEYIIESDNPIVSTSYRWGCGFTVATCRDKSKWVIYDCSPKEMFCGYLYLKNSLENAGLKTIQVAEQKMTLYKGKVILLSRYCGDNPPNDYDMEIGDIPRLRDRTGFMNLGTVDRIANLRKQNGVIYVTDTDIENFEGSRREAIKAFMPTCENVRSFLEQIAMERSKRRVHFEEPPQKRRKTDLDS